MNNSNNDTKRESFLLHLYDNYWKNIITAEDTSWKAMTAVTALFGIFVYIGGLLEDVQAVDWKIYFTLITLAAILVFGISSSLRGNLWFNRNIHLISNIEELFLDTDDWDKILPKEFKDSGNRFFDVSAIWWLHIFYYQVLLVIIFIISYHTGDSIFTAALISISEGIVFAMWVINRNKLSKHKTDKTKLRPG